MSDAYLPYAQHSVDEADVEAVAAVLRGGALTGGPAVASLEREFTDRFGAAHAVACSSGTAALHLAALALDWGPGDAIIVPAVTFLATANVARYVGAEVVFADVDPDHGLLTPETMRAALQRAGGAAKGAIPVHLAGQVVDMPELASLTKPAGLAVVEDACHALATETDWGPVGNCAHSDIATFSLHPAKTVAMGEGGMAMTNDARLAQAMTRLRSHGMVREAQDYQERSQAFDDTGADNPWYYEMHQMGFNYRAPDILCALGASQMHRLGAFAARRRALAARYDRLLAPLAPHVRPIARARGCQPVWHLYPVLVDFRALGRSRADMMRFLEDRSIGSQVHYLPLHRQPYYRERYGALDLPGADAYYARTLSLPLFAAMSDADVDRVVEAVTAFVQRSN